MTYEEWLDGNDLARLPDHKVGQIIRADKDFAFVQVCGEEEARKVIWCDLAESSVAAVLLSAIGRGEK